MCQNRSLFKSLILVYLLSLCAATPAYTQTKEDSLYIQNSYKKIERYIPMRDGANLFTAIYIPNDSTKQYPILFTRTPYSLAPYGADNYKVPIGPNMLFAKEGFIIVYQDVRGRYLSEGEFIANRPIIPNKKSPDDIDESSDTYDTIDWLLKNIKTNGKVGVWGISASGFYTTTAIIDVHPAVKAASPQAPVTDWFMGDDRHHNGAFFLMGSFSFLSSYGQYRDSITTNSASGFYNYGTPDGYDFYLRTGALKNFNTLLKKKNILWNDMMSHPNYDDFWKARNPLQYLKKIKPAILTVGGWFDQEDLYGPLKTFAALEEAGPVNENYLIMGPWRHGSWTRGAGDSLEMIGFKEKTAEFYRKEIEFPFFMHYLKGTENPELPKAYIFETGLNQWRKYTNWPPKEAEQKNLYLQAGGKLSFDKPVYNEEMSEEYVSDPNKPVPYSSEIRLFRGHEFMVEDQGFASTRTDVLVFETDTLKENVTIAGNIIADLFVSTTGTDADFVVKLIDVYPNTSSNKMGGYQLMVRGEVMRSKFRNSFSDPEALVPNKISEVEFDMQDASHTFLKGHKIMVQIQSSWFPLVDRNPQQFINIYEADDKDFKKETHRIYVDRKNPSHLKLRIINNSTNEK